MKKFSDYTPTSFVGAKDYKRCYESHPPLKIGEYTVYGGSCSNPVVTDADVYVGFDGVMDQNPMVYPWNPGVAVSFYIPDMGTPKVEDEFVKMVTWIADQVRAGKKVHMGCIGGHGRTGMVLSALYCELTGNKQAIQYVREHYCKKAVESDKQVAFLNRLFGIEKVKGSKPSFTSAPPMSKLEDYPGFPGDETWPWTKPSNMSRMERYVRQELIDVPPRIKSGSIWDID